MSYSIYLTFTDGKPIVNTQGDIPEGMWQIGGHEDDYGQGINVCHKDLNGMHIAEAHHHRSNTMYDEAQFIGAATDDLPTRLMRLGFTAEQAEHYLLDPDEPMPGPAPEVETSGGLVLDPMRFRSERESNRCDACGRVPNPVTAPCPQCPDNDIPEPTGELPEDYGDDAPLTDLDT